MKIAYCTESLPPKKDGVSKSLSRLADTLESQGIDFRFFSPVKPDESISWRDKVRKVTSVPFPLYTYYEIGLPMFENLDEEFDEFEPDLIHIASQTLLGMYGLNYAKKHHLPVVSSYHTHFISYFRYYGVQFAEKWGWSYLRWFHNQCMCNYAPSPSAAEELRIQGIQNVDLWQRGIDLEKFSPNYRDLELRRSVGADEDTPILLFVARLVKEKDLDDLIDAVKMLRSWEESFKVVIVGDGPMKDEIKQRLPEAHLPGFLQGEILSKWYASSDIFTFPSTTETFGNVILEAFASGIPAVGVKKGGVGDLITPDYDGFLAEPNDPDDFAKKIQPLLKDKQLRWRLGEQAKLTAKKNSWQHINQRLLDSYQRVITRFKQKDRIPQELSNRFRNENVVGIS